MPSWQIRSGDAIHTVQADIHEGWRSFLTIAVDGQTEHESDKTVMVALLEGDYPVTVGPHQGRLRIRRNWFMQDWKYELELDGQPLAVDETTRLAAPSIPSEPQTGPATEQDASPREPTQPTPAPATATTPVVPTLPPSCPNCGAALAMSSVEWTGPMSARCPSCGSGVAIRWHKIGE